MDREIEKLEQLKKDMQEAKNNISITHDGWFYWSLKKDYEERKKRLSEELNKS